MVRILFCDNRRLRLVCPHVRCLYQGRHAHIVEEVGEFLRPKEAEVVPELYRKAVGAEQESATPLNNRELHSSKMVEAAGIEPEGIFF